MEKIKKMFCFFALISWLALSWSSFARAEDNAATTNSTISESLGTTSNSGDNGTTNSSSVGITGTAGTVRAVSVLSDQYEPIARTRYIKTGTIIEAKDSIANSYALPSDASYAFKEPINTEVADGVREEERTAIVVVTYSDGSIDELTVSIKIEGNIIERDYGWSPAVPYVYPVTAGDRKVKGIVKIHDDRDDPGITTNMDIVYKNGFTQNILIAVGQKEFEFMVPEGVELLEGDTITIVPRVVYSQLQGRAPVISVMDYGMIPQFEFNPLTNRFETVEKEGNGIITGPSIAVTVAGKSILLNSPTIQSSVSQTQSEEYLGITKVAKDDDQNGNITGRSLPKTGTQSENMLFLEGVLLFLLGAYFVKKSI